MHMYVWEKNSLPWLRGRFNIRILPSQRKAERKRHSHIHPYASPDRPLTSRCPEIIITITIIITMHINMSVGQYHILFYFFIFIFLSPSLSPAATKKKKKKTIEVRAYIHNIRVIFLGPIPIPERERDFRTIPPLTQSSPTLNPGKRQFREPN